MDRGGRSCASEMKVGGGVARSGKRTAVKPSGIMTAGTLLTNGVSEQYTEHILHLSATA